MPIPPSPGPFYTAAAAFRTRCLATDDSLFTPGRPIWTAATAEDLYVRFVETPDVRTGVGFIAKLEGQLEGAQPATVQFAAEAVFVHLLGEADTSASTHGADDSATVHEDSPQGHGWSSESLTEAGGPEDETSGEPILPEPEQQTSEGDGKAEPEPAFSKSGTRKAPRKSTSGKGR